MRGKRWLWVVLAVGAILLGVASVLLLVALPRYVEAKVLSTAEANGVDLKPGRIAFGFGWVELTQVKLNLERVRSVEVQVGRIDITLAGFSPLSIELTNVDGRVTGSITNVGLELSEWTKNHPDAYALPLSARSVHARFVDPAGAAPWLEVSGGELTRTRTGGVFAAKQCQFVGVDLGKVGAGFSREASNIALGFGETDLSRAPFRVEVSPEAKIPSATFTLAPISAERLARPLGIPLAIPGVTVSSLTTVEFAQGASAGALSGTTLITLEGYVPPHPFELDGFIFGDTTRFDTKFSLPATRNRINFTDSHLQAGRFELRGDGLLTRGSDHSEITMTLKGELPCTALAAVEAESRLSRILGSALGAKASAFAAKWVNGSVRVGLKLSADTRNLLLSRIERTIGVGCGLHPLSVTELAKLVPFPADVAQLLRNLPAPPSDLSSLPTLPLLPSGLPALPSALPTGLPAIPDLGLPMAQPLAAPARTTTSAPSVSKPSSSAASKPAASK